MWQEANDAKRAKIAKLKTDEETKAKARAEAMDAVKKMKAAKGKGSNR